MGRDGTLQEGGCIYCGMGRLARRVVLPFCAANRRCLEAIKLKLVGEAARDNVCEVMK